MFQQNINYMNAINHLRGMTDPNKEHAKHIFQITRCIEDAFSHNNIQYDMSFWEVRETLKKQQQEIDELKRIVQMLEKNNMPPSAPMAADIFITPESLKQAKKDLRKALN